MTDSPKEEIKCIRYKCLINGTSDGIAICNLDGTIKTTNKKFRSITSFNEQEMIDSAVTNIIQDSADIIKKIKSDLLEKCTIKNTFINTKQGEQKQVDLRSCISPALKEIIFSIHDKTKRRKINAQLKTQNKFLYKINKISNQVQDTHDLKRIINIAIRGFRTIGYDRVRLYLYDSKLKLLVGKKASDISDKAFRKISYGPSQNIKAYDCFLRRVPLIQKEDSSYHDTRILKTRGVKEIGYVPLIGRDKVLGIIVLDNKHTENKIQIQDLVNLMPLANQIAYSLENVLLLREDRKKLRKLTAMYDVSRAFRGTPDIEKILNTVIVKIIKLIKCDLCTTYLFEKSNSSLVPQSRYTKIENIPYEALDINKSVAGLACKSKQPKYVEDVQKEKLYAQKSFAFKKRLKSLLSIPLIINDRAIGAINIYTKKIRHYSRDETDLLKGLANQAALSVKNCELYSKISANIEKLSQLLEISQVINSELDLNNLLKKILDKTVEFTKADSGLILVLREGRLDLKYLKGYGDERKNKEISIKTDQGISGWVARNGIPLVIPDVTKDSRYVEFYKTTVSEAAIPLIKAGKVIGVLNLESKKYDNFGDMLQYLGVLTNHISIAIENSRYYHEISLFNENTCFRIGKYDFN